MNDDEFQPITLELRTYLEAAAVSVALVGLIQEDEPSRWQGPARDVALRLNELRG